MLLEPMIQEAMPIIVAAGVLLTAPSGTILLLKRSGLSDMAGAWCLPGGKVEAGETIADAAIRETMEETGYEIDQAGQFLLRRVADGVDFTTFQRSVPAEFVPTLNEEHTAFAWMTPIDALAEPTLHPGVVTALRRLDMDELGVAQAMAAGEIASPCRYANVLLVDMRITGTGVSYRRAKDEFVYRRPEDYLTPAFLARCNGLPVILMHPDGATLNSQEFSDRIAGTMFLPYLKGSEVWGIAKIYDDDTKELLETEQLSTSPAVVLRGGSADSKMQLEDGSTLLIEGKPKLLDHLAICQNGVWDKGQEPNGIRADSTGEPTMTDEELKAKKDAEEAEAKKKADADSGEKLDKVLAHLDSVATMCDTLSKRMDAFEKEDEPKRVAADKAKKDAEDKEKADKARKDGERNDASEEEKEEEERKADKARRDAEETEKKEKADRAKADADIAKRIADVEAKLPKPVSDADYAAMADAQARADGVFHAFGDRAPRPLDGETVAGYRRRIATQLKVHSKTWKDVDLSKIGDAGAFEPIEGQIYKDAADAADHPVDLAAGELREIVSTDRATGRRMTTFKGANTFIRGMSRAPRIANLNLDTGRRA